MWEQLLVGVVQAAAGWGVYAAPRLLMLGAWRQVYEIKAQCPINNLAAYYKTYTKYNSYCLQQSDVYTHFKCTSVSSIYSIWCGFQNQTRRKERTLSPPLPSEALSQRSVNGKKPFLYPNYPWLCSGLPYPHTLSPTHFSLSIYVFSENLRSLIIHSEVGFLLGVPFTEQS